VVSLNTTFQDFPIEDSQTCCPAALWAVEQSTINLCLPKSITDCPPLVPIAGKHLATKIGKLSVNPCGKDTHIKAQLGQRCTFEESLAPSDRNGKRRLQSVKELKHGNRWPK
jgi:hypothetical protein